MTEWIVEGSLTEVTPGRPEPSFVSEPFLTEEGAKHFAILLTERGYAVAARRLGGEGRLLIIAGAALVDWMNSEQG